LSNVQNVNESYRSFNAALDLVIFLLAANFQCNENEIGVKSPIITK